MGNINTYLQWRGDLTLEERPFCEADNLVLAIFSYLDLGKIVAANETRISVQQAYEKYQELGITHFTGDDSYRQMFEAMAASRRFRMAELSNYREIIDESRATQFAAIQISLEDGSHYLSFRGTDYSIIGWQEDFNMGSEVVAAQQEAVRYVNEVMKPGQEYRIGGHSKGGNLAIYSTLYCEEALMPWVLAVYNNDGPGLSDDIVSEERYQRIEQRLYWMIPEYSVIGTLFPHGAPTWIVASNAEGLLQHNPFTWQLEGDRFVERERLSQSCQFYVDIFDTWINSADLEHRKAFTCDFFEALKAGGAKNMDEVLGSGIDGFGTVLLSIVQSESRTKIVIGKFIQSFLMKFRSINLRETLHSKTALQGGLLMTVGFFLMLFPSAALRLLGTVVGLMGIFWLGKRILSCAVNESVDDKQKKRRILSCLLCMAAVEFLIVNKNTILMSSHLILGIFLLGLALHTFYHIAKESHSRVEQLLMSGAGVIAMLLSMVNFTKHDGDRTVIFTLGTFFAAYGAFVLVRTIYRNGANQAKKG